MPLGQILWRTELAALVALLICAIVVAMVLVLEALFNPNALFSNAPEAAALVGLFYTIGLGALPSFVYGAPIYAVLAHRRRATWPVVILIGMLPGAIASIFDDWWGTMLLVCGITVSVGTHLLLRGRLDMRSNPALNTDAGRPQRAG